MFEYAIDMYELRNLLQCGEIDSDDLTEEQLEELDRMEADEARRSYAEAYSSYMKEWQ